MSKNSSRPQHHPRGDLHVVVATAVPAQLHASFPPEEHIPKQQKKSWIDENQMDIRKKRRNIQHTCQTLMAHMARKLAY